MLSRIVSTFKNLVKYFGAVSVGFIVDVIVFLVLSGAGAPIVIANSIAFAVGFSVNVLLVRRLVFPGNDVPHKVDFAATFLINVVVMAIGTWIIWTLNRRFGQSLFGSKLIASGFTLSLNFAGRSILEAYWKCSPNYRKEP